MSEITDQASSEESWISTSDLMAGLMIIFLFIAIAYIKSIGQEEEQATQSICQQLERALEDVDFRDRIEICTEPLVVRFIDPETLFERGSATLEGQFEDMLDEFIPRYMGVVNRNRSKIEKVRIEGHTDESWANETDTLRKFYNNMFLSQQRTYSVLYYTLLQPSILNLAMLQADPARPDVSAASGDMSNSQWTDWVLAHLESAGRSSSDPIRDVTGAIDPDRSRRVDFRINLNVKDQLLQRLGGGTEK